VSPRFHSRFFFLPILVFFSFWASSCAVPLGPGYTIEKHGILVHYVAKPEAHLEITASYRLLNSGNQPLDMLRLKIPDAAFYDLADVRVQVDQQFVSLQPSDPPMASAVHLHLDPPWKQKERREISIQYQFRRGLTRKALVAFTAEDAFYLSPVDWHPVLLPPEGMFASVRESSKDNELTLRVPHDFQINAGGRRKGKKAEGAELVVRFENGKSDAALFAVAGRYSSQQVRIGQETFIFWSRRPYLLKDAQNVAANTARITTSFDAILGPRPNQRRTIWLIECPCANRTVGLRGPEGMTATAMDTYGPVPDTALLGAELIEPGITPFVAAKLVPSWSGSDGKLDESSRPPMNQLDVYVATLAELSSALRKSRQQEISDLLRQFTDGRAFEAQQIQDEVSRKRFLAEPETEDPYKALLFFFALEDRFGRENLHKALRHVVQARHGQGNTLEDLIAALEQETHQNVAEFVRLWMKHPGVPEEFRARYGEAAAATAQSEKETTP
jgi:hypothetical protein